MIKDTRADSEIDPRSVRATADNVFIRILPISTVASGLQIVSGKEAWESKHPIKAEVMSAGPWCENLKKGDIIVIVASEGRWVGDSDGDGVSYRMIKEDQALALVTKRG